MSRDLAQRVLALELAQNAHADFETTLAASSDTGWLLWTPSAPFQGVIMYWATYGDMVSGVIELRARHRGYSRGVKLIGTDEIIHGAASWIYITDQEPLEYKISNLDTIARAVKCTFWYLNVMTLRDLDIIKVVMWEHVAPGMLRIAAKYGFLPQLPNLPSGMLTDIIKYGLLPQLPKEVK